MRSHRTIALLTLCAGLLASPAAFAQKAKDIVRIAQAQTIGTLDAYMDPRPEVYFLSDAVFDSRHSSPNPGHALMRAPLSLIYEMKLHGMMASRFLPMM